MKVAAKSDIRFQSYEFSKFKGFLIMGNLELATPQVYKCDVIVQNSPLVLYTEFHIFSFFFNMQFEIRNQHNFFRNVCRFDVAISYSHN